MSFMIRPELQSKLWPERNMAWEKKSPLSALSCVYILPSFPFLSAVHGRMDTRHEWNLLPPRCTYIHSRCADTWGVHTPAGAQTLGCTYTWAADRLEVYIHLSCTYTWGVYTPQAWTRSFCFLLTCLFVGKREKIFKNERHPVHQKIPDELHREICHTQYPYPSTVQRLQPYI